MIATDARSMACSTNTLCPVPQMLSGLFTYVATISLPWRLANAVHLYSSRSAEPSAGFDFYGRKTDNIWFNVPWGKRAAPKLTTHAHTHAHARTCTRTHTHTRMHRCMQRPRRQNAPT